MEQDRRIKIIYKKLIKSLLTLNYVKIYKYIKELSFYHEEKRHALLFMRLLDLLHHIDESDRDIAKEYKNKTISDARDKELSTEEKIEYYSLTGSSQYTNALKELEKYRNVYGQDDYYNVMILLLNELNLKTRVLDEKVNHLTSIKDFDGIKELLNREYFYHNLERRFKADVYDNIKDGNYLKPEIIQPEKKGLYVSIRVHDFKAARELSKERSKNYRKNPIYVVLNEIVKELNRIEIDNALSLNRDRINSLRKLSMLDSSNEFNTGDVIRIFELNEEEAMIYKLLIAIKAFQNHESKIGNMLIKEVETSEEKTPLVLALLDETRRCKKLYKNQKVAHLSIS